VTWEQIQALVFSECSVDLTTTRGGGLGDSLSTPEHADAYVLGEYVVSLGVEIDTFVDANAIPKIWTHAITDKAFPDGKI
jgi:hypothetical protein